MKASFRNKAVVRLIAVLIAVAVFTFLAIAVRRARNQAYASVCQGKLAQLALAIRNYQNYHGDLPPAFLLDEGGRPAHSWRVLILPFLEEEDAYKDYKLSEPWDGPHNTQWAKMHSDLALLFKCPSDTGSDQWTSYLAPTGAGSLWPGSEPHRLTAKDATRVLLVEVRESSIHWLEPRDLPFDRIEISAQKSRDLSGHRDESQMRFIDADGRVGVLSAQIRQ
jgi:hypothetical protein